MVLTPLTMHPSFHPKFKEGWPTMDKNIARIPLRVIFYRDEEDKTVWVAHCLEFDLLGHGGSQRAAAKMLGEAIFLQLKSSIQSRNIANLFTPAPAEYQLMYAKGKDIATAELKIEVDTECEDYKIDEIEAREYDDGYADCNRNPRLALV
jgi:hypothetical protein